MKLILAAAAVAFLSLAPTPSSAHGHGGPLAAEPPAAWTQGYVVRRQRVVRPGSRVVVRTVRERRPVRVERCRVVRQRVVRPNGRVVVRVVRTCR
jgi:acyl dehydratase